MTVEDLIQELSTFGGHLPVGINVHDDKPVEGITTIDAAEIDGQMVVQILVSDDPADRP